jgi:hypothetical protein
MIITDPINQYFLSKGIDVCYNTLNSNELLYRSYINDFQSLTDSSAECKSHHVKDQIYRTMYDFTSRQKFTGFENFKKLDRDFRRSISSLIKRSQFAPGIVISKNENKEINIPFKEALKQRVKEFNNPLLYYSGGMDSELVANAMLDAGVKFTPVIFELTDNSGTCRNLHDIHYAYQYCSKHGLFPIIKKINIEELWRARDFVDLSLELQIQSPQLVTHAYMIQMMSNEYPERSHVFGGEVRFYSDYLEDNGELANLVLLAKTTPGYTGSSYFCSSFTGGTPASLSLVYNSDGSWDVNGTGNQTVDSDSGTWTTTPSTPNGYEYRISAISGVTTQGLGQVTPSGAPTSYASLAGGAGICEAVSDPFAPASIADATWTIQVRTAAGAQQGTVMTSTITFGTEYNA